MRKVAARCNALYYDQPRHAVYVCDGPAEHTPGEHLDTGRGKRWPHTIDHPLRPAALALLRHIAGHDHGDGVTVAGGPRGRWVLNDSYAANTGTFRLLHRMHLVDIEADRPDVVHLTNLGRDYLDRVDHQRGYPPPRATTEPEPEPGPEPERPAASTGALHRATTDRGLRTAIARAFTGRDTPPGAEHHVEGFAYDLADLAAPVAQEWAAHAAADERRRAISLVIAHLAPHAGAELDEDVKALCDAIAGDRRLRVPARGAA